jgi:hypothetical protein
MPFLPDCCLSRSQISIRPATSSRPTTYAQRLDWLSSYGASALFAAGALGEFFSLTPPEFVQVIRTAVDTCLGKIALIAGVGARRARRLPMHRKLSGLEFKVCFCSNRHEGTKQASITTFFAVSNLRASISWGNRCQN